MMNLEICMIRICSLGQEILTIYTDKINPSSRLAFRKFLKHVRIPAKLIVDQLTVLLLHHFLPPKDFQRVSPR